VILSNTMYPLPSSYSAISQLNDQFYKLQVQLATGNKASTLADMGDTRYTSLVTRSQIGKVSGYDSSIATVNLRLSMTNTVLTSLSKVQSDTRGASVAGGYGSNNVNLTTAPTQAKSQLDQVLTSLSTDLNNRYLFGGGASDHAPVVTTTEAMNGTPGFDGFTTIARQRLEADQGADGLGRLAVGIPAATPDTVSITEDNAAFGFKLATLSSSNATGVTPTGPTGTPASLSVKFTTQPAPGDTVTIGVKMPDGTTDNVVMTAVAATVPPTTPKAGEFVIGATTADTATNFSAAVQGSLVTEGKTKLAAASNYAAADNFFNGQGQQVRRPTYDATGHSYTATGYATPAQTQTDTVQWYTGQDDATKRLQADQGGDDLGRLSLANPVATPDTVTLAQTNATYGYQLSSASTTNAASINMAGPAGTPPSLSVQFTALPNPADKVTIGVKLPDGSTDSLVMTAVAAAPSKRGEYQIGASPAATAANFNSALQTSLQTETQTKMPAASAAVYAATGQNARGSVTAKIDDGTIVSYGVEANETGTVNLVRSLAVQSIQTYPTPDAATTALSKAKFDAIANGQLSRLSAGNDSRPGSLATMAVDLGLVQKTVKDTSDRHTAYTAQLQTVLANAEVADPAQVTEALLQLQTRLQASYQATAIIGQLQLSNYIK
jgi:flagellar hook-associated protein 3 FlgL